MNKPPENNNASSAWAESLSRRSFLRWTALAGVTSMLGWRFFAPAHGKDLGLLKNLSMNQAKILAAAYAAITLEAKPEAIDEAMAFMDQFVGKLDVRTRVEFKAALMLVEHSPVFFHGYLRRFTALDSLAQNRCLEGWRSGYAWRRPVFGALKDLSFLYFYTRPEHWEKIRYPGPLVVKGNTNPAYEARYKGLEAKP